MGELIKQMLSYNGSSLWYLINDFIEKEDKLFPIKDLSNKILSLFPLKDKRKVDVIIVMNTRFIRQGEGFFDSLISELEKRGISYKKVFYFRNFDGLKKYLKYESDCNCLNSYYSKKDNIRYKFLKTWAVIKESYPKYKFAFKKFSKLVEFNINCMKNLIEKEKPKVIIGSHANEFYLKGCVFNKRDTKIIALQQEIISEEDIIQVYSESNYLRPNPDIICCWDEKSKDLFINKAKYPIHILRITGNPYFDSLINSKSENKRYTLVIGQFYHEDNKLIADYIKDKEYKDIIIKAHPKGSEKDTKIFSDYKIANEDSDLRKLILGAERVVGYTSLALLEAKLANKETIVIKGNIRGSYSNEARATQKVTDVIEDVIHDM